MCQYPEIEINGERTYRRRYQQSLIQQINADYLELIRRWNGFRNGKSNIENGERILEKIAWIKKSIEKIEVIRVNDIEGINWGELKKIDENINSMEFQIIRIMGIFPSEINSVTFGEVHSTPVLKDRGEVKKIEEADSGRK